MKHANTPLRLTTLSLALALALSACGKSPEAHFQDGQKFIQQTDFKSAALELKIVLQEQPANREARLLLGQAQYHLGDYASAEKELTKARDLGATEDQVLPLLAMSQLRMGQRKKVLDLTIPGSGLSPRSLATLHTARAEALLATGKRPEAETSIASAIQADAKLPDLLLLQAKLALSDKRPDQATQLIDSALQNNPKFADALYLKASLLQTQDKPDEAIKLYQQIIANDPSQFRAQLAIASLQLKKGNSEAAEQAIQAAEKVAGKAPMVRHARGMLELRRGKLDKASSALLDVLRVAPDHLPSMLAYAMASYGLGNYDQSMKNAGRVLGAVPDNLIAAKILAGSQIKIGDVKGALKTLDPFLAKHDKDAKLLALAGEAYLQSKDYIKAMNYLDKAAELDPENATIKTRHALGNLATGDSKAALADIEQAASLSEKPGQADFALVIMHMKDKEYDKALQAIASLEKKLPNNPVTYTMRAAAKMGKKDMAGARQTLEQALTIQPSFMPAALNLARLDILENKPDAARKRFESVLAADKTNVKAMMALADLAAAEKKDKDQVGWLEKAMKTDPKHLQSYSALVRHYLAKKDNIKAIAIAKQAVTNNPEDVQALNLLGATQVLGNDAKSAIETYKQLSRKAPNSADVQLLLGSAQAAANLTADARYSLNMALKIKPDSIATLDTFIRLEMLEKNPNAALLWAKKMQAAQPKSPLGYEREGDIHMAQQHFPQASKSYQQALDTGAGTQGLIKLHAALIRMGNTKAAYSSLEAWVKSHPNDLAARAYLAGQAMQAGQNQVSITQYEEILRQRPNDVMALNNLANLYQRNKDPRALSLAERAYQGLPQNPAIQDTLGWILIEQGQIKKGLDLLSKAANQLVKNPTIQYHYALALARNGNKTQSREVLQRVLSSPAKFPDAEAAKSLYESLK